MLGSLSFFCWLYGFGYWINTAFARQTAARLAVVIWFTKWDTQTDLGSLTALLRFDDMWGNARGFVYKRSFRAFHDYTWLEKLFGKGLGQTLSILTPYCDNQAAIDYAGGVFTDTHCQPIQLLLTCGLVGMAAFLAFYVFTNLSTKPTTSGGDILLFTFSHCLHC